MILLQDRRYIVEIPNFLSSEEIDLIQEHVKDLPTSDGTISETSADSSTIGFTLNKNIRSTSIKWIGFSPEMRWLWIKIIDMINGVNHDYFHMDIGVCDHIQHGTYTSPGGTYKSHMDTVDLSYPQRKISFSIQLTDEHEYEGGDLLIYKNSVVEPYKASRKKGSLTVFFSMYLHEVTPVTVGTRQSLVSWVLGPALK